MFLTTITYSDTVLHIVLVWMNLIIGKGTADLEDDSSIIALFEFL
jgi:hypothetical protein